MGIHSRSWSFVAEIIPLSEQDGYLKSHKEVFLALGEETSGIPQSDQFWTNYYCSWECCRVSGCHDTGLDWWGYWRINTNWTVAHTFLCIIEKICFGAPIFPIWRRLFELSRKSTLFPPSGSSRQSKSHLLSPRCHCKIFDLFWSGRDRGNSAAPFPHRIRD